MTYLMPNGAHLMLPGWEFCLFHPAQHSICTGQFVECKVFLPIWTQMDALATLEPTVQLGWGSGVCVSLRQGQSHLQPPEHADLYQCIMHVALHAGLFYKGQQVGVLGMEMHTRRRNRVNCVIEHVEGQSVRFRVGQSYGNCPKYIQVLCPACSFQLHIQMNRKIKHLAASCLPSSKGIGAIGIICLHLFKLGSQMLGRCRVCRGEYLHEGRVHVNSLTSQYGLTCLAAHACMCVTARQGRALHQLHWQ